MTEIELIQIAQEKGYTIYEAPEHYKKSGFRIDGSKVDGSDNWMNAANVRLRELQNQ